jgi:trimethylamine--corrinoid protein Co-methyltransferase
LAGANVIFGMGMLDLGVTFSFTQLIMDDIIVNNVKDLIEGDMLSKALCDSTGMEGKGLSSRLWSPQRVRNCAFSTDTFLPRTPDILITARQKIQSILDYHKPEPVASRIERRLREIILEEDDKKGRGRRSFSYD